LGLRTEVARGSNTPGRTGTGGAGDGLKKMLLGEGQKEKVGSDPGIRVTGPEQAVPGSEGERRPSATPCRPVGWPNRVAAGGLKRPPRFCRGRR